MFAQALIAFLVLPGIVGLLVPATWAVLHPRTEFVHPIGLLLLATGAIALLWCVRDFYVFGKGTLAPWAPPRELVVVGLYRYTRNPMYVAVVLILMGWAASFGSIALLIYGALVAMAFHLRVVMGEERWLSGTHGEVWKAYAARVPRWFW